MHINFEFKARCSDLEGAETRLKELNPLFIGTDHQVDTYFKVNHGRLKLREGQIEQALIHYERRNEKGMKQSDVLLYQHKPDARLKEILSRSLGILAVVDKCRRIYFIDNVKFHFDTVEGLGNFIEVEAIDKEGTIGIGRLKEQCNVYAQLFNVHPDSYVAESYSDLLVKKSSTILSRQ